MVAGDVLSTSALAGSFRLRRHELKSVTGQGCLPIVVDMQGPNATTQS